MKKTAEPPPVDGDLAKSTGVTHPLVLLQSAIDRGLDAEQLGKLMDLSERWEANQASKAFNVAMNACQKEMPIVVRVQPNDKGKLYATLDAVQKIAVPILTKHGFSLSWSSGTPLREGEDHLVCIVRHIGGHSESHHGYYPFDGIGPKGGAVMNAVQGRVSSHTYAQRDMMRQIFNMTIADQDKDGNGGAGITESQVVEINNLIDQLAQLGQWGDIRAEKFREFCAGGSPPEGWNLDQLSDKAAQKAIDFLNRALVKAQRK